MYGSVIHINNTVGWHAQGAPGPTGGGGIIRDCTGRLSYAYSLNYGICGYLKAEMKAATFGLELAKRMGVKKLIFQMDNQAGVLALKSMEPYGGECVHTVQDCIDLIKDSSWEVVVIHCYREGNRATGWLVNQGASQTNKVELIQIPPLNLGRIIHEDIVGVAMSRLVPI